MPAGDQRGALDGIRVLDFTQMMLGPYATQLLGDLGADVIKIERPAGEWERGLPMMGELLGADSADDGHSDSAAFLAMNRNKRSVALDLKDSRAREALLALGRTADVVVENFRPGVMSRLGLGYEDFERVNERVIFCSGSGWGQDGRFAEENRPGQDLLVQAMSGIAANTGPGDGPPVFAGTSIIDATTALTLAVGVLGALVARERQGIGQWIQVDLFSTAISLQCQEISAMVNQGKGFERSAAGIASPWLSAPCGVYPTADGWLAIAMTSLEDLARIVGEPSIAELDPWVDRDEIKVRLERVTPGRTTGEWLEALAPQGIWAAPVRSLEAAVDELRASGHRLIRRVEYRGRELELIACPVIFGETPASVRLSPPTIGEHTAEVLAEVLEPDALADLLGPGDPGGPGGPTDDTAGGAR